ncbi:MAG: hypothetical protein AAB930_01065 [Patescibacteria group bacterium]
MNNSAVGALIRPEVFRNSEWRICLEGGPKDFLGRTGRFDPEFGVIMSLVKN